MSRYGRTPTKAPVALFAGLVIAITMGALFLVPPDRETRMRQYLADGEDGAALGVVQQRGVVADLSERGLADLADLYLRLGRLDAAASAIDSGLARYPESPWPAHKKTELINTVGSFDERLAWARELLERPAQTGAMSNAARKLLLAEARRKGDAAGEIALIEAGQDNAVLNPRQWGRLGLLLAARGRTQMAIRALRAPVEAGVATDQERHTLEALVAEHP